MKRTASWRGSSAVLCSAAIGALLAFAAVGQEFPARPIDIVTHASPGGGTDATARSMVLGTKLALDVDMAVVPRTGGGGVVALNYVNSRPRDGHTVLAITPTHLFAIARGQGRPAAVDQVLAPRMRSRRRSMKFSLTGRRCTPW